MNFQDADDAIRYAEDMAKLRSMAHAVCDTDRGLTVLPVSEAKALGLHVLETVEAVA